MINLEIKFEVSYPRRSIDSRGFLFMQPNPFVDKVGIEAVVQGDAGNGRHQA